VARALWPAPGFVDAGNAAFRSGQPEAVTAGGTFYAAQAWGYLDSGSTT